MKQRYESHKSCTHPSTLHYCPTRLVHFSAFDLQVSPRLVLAADLPCDTQYATLSHCWDNIELFQLKRENFGSLRKCIPRNLLCKTFQDAIRIAQGLGLEYLWIDSLCIIQDDIEDWRKELASVSKVYGFSTINIAAPGAINGNVGCFFK